MNSPQQDSNFSFIVTSRLIKILKVLVGNSIAITNIDKINKGVIDLVSGFIVSQNFDNAQGLIQVSVQTDAEGVFTLTTNEINAFTGNILDLFNNSYLINRPREICIRNLSDFSERFRYAARYRQYIDCIYDRRLKQLMILRISSIPILEKSKKRLLKPYDSIQETSTHIPLPIEVRFVGQFTDRQKVAFQVAADRWGEILVGDLPKVRLNDEVIDGVVIYAMRSALDSEGKRLAQASPIHLRPGLLLPATGMMQFDIADLDRLEMNDSLVNLVTHEMGHVLGFGSLWDYKGLLKDVGTTNPTYIGKNAVREYSKLLGSTKLFSVPVENIGVQGTRYGHWREALFKSEMMSSLSDVSVNPISRVTIAAMEDIGYSVNYDSADPFFILVDRGSKETRIYSSRNNHCFCNRCNRS